MAKASKGGYYAVRVGRKPGVYLTWDECQQQVNGFPAAKHKKFPSRAEAEAFAGVRGSAQANIPVGKPISSLPRSDGGERVKRPASEQSGPPTKRSKPDPVTRSGQMPKGRVVYCDGSARGNGQKGATAGIGVFWGHEVGAKNLSERLPGAGKLQTNNRAEMYAVARILETDPLPELPLTICSDSEYTIGVFSKWISGWKRRGWKTSDGKPVANQDLIRYVLSLLALRAAASSPPSSSSSTLSATSSTSVMTNVTFHKVKAHVGIEGNEQADRFANLGALSPEVEERDFEKETRENERKLREGKGAVKRVEDVKWGVEIEEGDLLDEEELVELERNQAF
ncbi:hypothetical protein JCM11251_001428 [Rhodosporidiobolus azoricus]